MSADTTSCVEAASHYTVTCHHRTTWMYTPQWHHWIGNFHTGGSCMDAPQGRDRTVFLGETREGFFLGQTLSEPVG